MSFVFYAVDVWRDKLGEGTAADPQYCTLEGIAKVTSENPPNQLPYVVANEFICGRLGLAIGLPIPPGVVTTNNEGKLAYISLRFGPKGELPPPANLAELVEDHPSIAAGVVAFDCWVGTPDRHERNNPQRPVTVFDFSHALFGPQQRNQAADVLRQQIDQPLVMGSVAQHLTSSKEFSDWADRISAIHNGLIEDLCRSLIHLGGVTADECDAATEFLTHRKGRVLDYIRASKGAMPHVDQWDLEAS